MGKLTLTGTTTALVTPFKRDGSVDYDSLQKLIELQIENKVEAICVCGSTGESATLTIKEKQAIIIKSVEYADGKVPIIAGTGSNDTEMAMNLSVTAKEYGADGILVVTPYYNKPTQEGLFEHYKIIADNSPLPIILYNVPGRTGVNMLPETQLKIVDACPNVVATKEASGDLIQMMEIIKNAPDGFSLLSGDDALAIPAISIGAKGVVSVISNYAPLQFGNLVRLALKGKYKEALKIHYELFDLMELNFIESNPTPVKAIMSIMGMIKPTIRLPLLLLKKENEKKIKDALKKANLIK